jgi:hypothetical protein
MTTSVWRLIEMRNFRISIISNTTESCALDAIIATWDQLVHCEIPTQTGAACRRPARWRINLHGCEQANTCGQHLRTWQGWAAASTSRCDHCKRTFSSPADAYTVTPL